MLPGDVALILDGGTSTTRVWATRADGSVVAEAKLPVGARNKHELAEGVRELVIEVAARCTNVGASPRVLVAGGMITSASGLFEVPHVTGPADIAALARGSRWTILRDVAPWPFLFVPGVRFGAAAAGEAGAAQLRDVDLVRGEELLCLGLVADGTFPDGGRVISLGSHWKRLDVAAQRLQSSRTTVAGELVAAVAAATIIGASLPPKEAGEWSEAWDAGWVRAGAAGAVERGLTRAIYEVRLLDVVARAEPAHRLAYLWGAVLGCELDSLLGDAASRVAVVGRPHLCAALSDLAAQRGVGVDVVRPAAAEAAYRSACLHILQARPFADPI